MKRLIPMLSVAMVFAGLSLFVRADDDAKVSLKGMAQCAKCALKEADQCQNVVVVKEDGEETKYFFVMNDVAKKVHMTLGFCAAKPGEGPMVKFEGTVEEKDGKKLVTATSITEAEE